MFEKPEGSALSECFTWIASLSEPPAKRSCAGLPSWRKRSGGAAGVLARIRCIHPFSTAMPT